MQATLRNHTHKEHTAQPEGAGGFVTGLEIRLPVQSGRR